MNSNFLIHPHNFHWATGIEDTFIPHTRPGFRGLDEYELTQHYRLWKEDLDLVAESGVELLRWGIPWYRIQPQPDTWDWSWTDAVLDYMVSVKRIRPVLDLMHYGTPLWLDNSFIHSSYPRLVADYACAVAERYRSLAPIYTPLNEPSINAELCGRKGKWPPYLTGDDGYYKVMLALSRGIALTVQALKSADPDAPIVHVEAGGRFWTNNPSPQVQARVKRGNLLRYLSTDLCLGRVTEDHPLYPVLAHNGFTRSDLEWFQANAVGFDVFGANFYPWSYGELKLRRDGTLSRQRRYPTGAIIGEILNDVWQYFRLPVMVTETSAKGTVDQRMRWMDETIEAVRSLRQQGVPVIGYTWFPFFTMFDWEYRTGRRPLADYRIHLGLYDCAFDEEGNFTRAATPLVDHYRAYTARPMPPLAPGALS